MLIFKRCFLVSRGKDALPFTKCFGRGLTKKDWQPHGLGGSNREGWKCCLLKTRKGSSDLLKTTSLQLGGGPSSLGHHGPCQQPGTLADRDGECLLVPLHRPSEPGGCTHSSDLPWPVGERLELCPLGVLIPLPGTAPGSCMSAFWW